MLFISLQNQPFFLGLYVICVVSGIRDEINFFFKKTGMNINSIVNINLGASPKVQKYLNISNQDEQFVSIFINIHANYYRQWALNTWQYWHHITYIG